jgi:cytochrome P450
MTLHPDVAHRAQVELDIVVGQSRLPRFEDRDQLPYIRAMLKETMRWRAVGPLGKLTLSAP